MRGRKHLTGTGAPRLEPRGNQEDQDNDPADADPHQSRHPDRPLWCPARREVDDLVVIAACELCGDSFLSEDADDSLCATCQMPPAEVAALRMTPAGCPPAPVAVPACETCGFVIRASDGGRCAACRRFYAELDARRTARIGGDAIAV